MIRRSVVVVAILLGLAGCTTYAHATPPDALNGPAPVPNRAPIGIPGGVIGTAPISSAAGHPLGTLTFRNIGTGIKLELPRVELGDPSAIIWALADSPFKVTQCGSDNIWEIGLPQQDALTLDDGMYAGGDPSFYTEVVVVRLIQNPNAMGCTQPIIATGPITWTIPLQRPWVAPREHGVATGARGSVTTDRGRPRVYTTASGDAWNSIAARFGITASDLDWLNPNRLGGGTPGEAYAQQLLNLDPKNRGDSESRRPH